MKKLTKKQVESIRRQVYRTARPIDLAVWQFCFEDGDAQKVLELLSNYQNADGGFAHALEADCWNPRSTPYQTWCALCRLLSIGKIDTPMARCAVEYLENCEGAFDGGWQFTVPANDAYPCAPWWRYDEKANQVQSFGLSLSLAQFVLLTGFGSDALKEKARRILLASTDALFCQSDFGEMGIGALLSLAQYPFLFPQGTDTAAAVGRICQLAQDKIERDPKNWVHYRPRPSAFIGSPQSPLYAQNADLMQLELDYLIDTLPENDLWEIPWDWSKSDPAAFAVSRVWWKAQRATETLMLLRNFDRIEI